MIENAGVVDHYVNSIRTISASLLYKTIEQSYFYFIASIASIVIIFIFVKVQYVKIRKTLWSILDQYEKMDRKHVYKQISLMTKFSKAINKIGNYLYEYLSIQRQNDVYR